MNRFCPNSSSNDQQFIVENETVKLKEKDPAASKDMSILIPAIRTNLSGSNGFNLEPSEKNDSKTQSQEATMKGSRNEIRKPVPAIREKLNGLNQDTTQKTNSMR